MISQLSISRRKALARLKTSRQRRQEGLFLIEGDKSVRQTLGLYECVAVVATSKWFESNPDIFSPTTELLQARGEDMRAVSSLSTPPDVIAVCRIPQQSFDESELADSLAVALDGVQDPGNFGTIIRTCNWFGIRTILCSHDCVDLYNPKTVQSTMGALGGVKVVYTDLVALLKMHPEINVFGTFLDGENIYKTSLPKTGVIVMGSEGHGISDELARTVNKRLYIPPGNRPAGCEQVESLNVAIATAIVLSQFQNSLING